MIRHIFSENWYVPTVPLSKTLYTQIDHRGEQIFPISSFKNNWPASTVPILELIGTRTDLTSSDVWLWGLIKVFDIYHRRTLRPPNTYYTKVPSFTFIHYGKVSRSKTLGRIPRITLDFRKQDSKNDFSLRFRLISRKFRCPDLIYVYISRFQSGSGVLWRRPALSSVLLRSGMESEAGIRAFPSISWYCHWSPDTWRPKTSRDLQLPSRYHATSNGPPNTSFGRLYLFT